MKKYVALCGVLCLCAYNFGAFGATATVKPKKQSVLQRGTTVRTRTMPEGLYDQACYEKYFGCLDQFCITDNTDGGTCSCSDKSAGFEEEFAKIQAKVTEAERVRTEEVEKIKAGANADIIFEGKRRYDEEGNLLGVGELSEKEKREQQRKDLIALFEDGLNQVEDEELWEDEDTSELVGDALYESAKSVCKAQLGDACAKDVKFLEQLYDRQIVQDCKAFENLVKTKSSEAEQLLRSAESDMRTALKESLEEANKYDLGQCMVNFKNCMLTDDACGTDWKNCVSVIASENMQNQKTKSVAGTKVKTVDVYDITESTMEILESKRPICENVLSQCVAVRNQVWPAFIREIAPTLKVAELNEESKMRQACLTDISDCIQKACKDDIEGKGVDTMDSCLSRPDMARSFCKVEIDRCERMEPMIWGYVVDKLAGMRVDACTQEVKECFTADTRCGEDFSNCIGMDYDYIHDICPIDTLVVCKANNPNFSMSDLDSMLMGLYLNIDNAFVENCQNLIDAKMMEVCGSTTDCNSFVMDDLLGTGSLRSQKDGTTYRVTGMISYGSIKMGMASTNVTDNHKLLKPGQIGIADYLEQVREKNKDVPNAENIIATIEEELNNLAGSINRTIEMIEMDPKIQYCVSGRDLTHITGKEGEKTQARFPNMLNQVKMQIATAALRQAQLNYNKKLNDMVTSAAKDASADVAQYLCQMLPTTGGVVPGTADTDVDVSTPLNAPYVISYDVANGLESTMLTQGGRGSMELGTGMSVETGRKDTKFGSVVETFTGLGGLKSKLNIGNGTRESWAIFNRDTRICHFCTSTVTKNCKGKVTKGFLGIGAKNEASCTESEPVENCQDIQM